MLDGARDILGVDELQQRPARQGLGRIAEDAREGRVAAAEHPVVAEDRQHVERRQQEQLLKLVTKGFYNELINYGVPRADIVTIASHLLGHVTAQEGESTTQGERQQRRMYSLDSLDDPYTAENEGVVRCTIESLCEDSYASPLRLLVGALPGPGRNELPAPG